MAAAKVALVTYEEFPNLTGGEVRLLDAMRAQGIAASCAIWSDSTIDWSAYTHVILRSCWDYHLRIDEFLRWITELEKVKANVFNRPDIIRWNADKSYLLDLEKRGVTIPKTEVITSNNAGELPNIVQGLNSHHIVVKPTVGASSYKIKKFASNDSRAVFYTQQLLRHSNVLIQEFIPEITNGEISASFFANELSHVVVKRPQKDDYRSNYGGHIQSFEPSKTMRQRLIDAYNKCGVTTFHARLDVVDTGDELVLIELELVDAELFFEYDDKSAARFVNCFTSL